MPTQVRSFEELNGYFRIDKERVMQAAKRKGFENPTQVAKAMLGAMSESSFFRCWEDQVAPSGRFLYALTTLLGCRVEELFDPVKTPRGQRGPRPRPRSD